MGEYQIVHITVKDKLPQRGLQIARLEAGTSVDSLRSMTSAIATSPNVIYRNGP